MERSFNRCPGCMDFMPGPKSSRKPCRVGGRLYCDILCATIDTGEVPSEESDGVERVCESRPFLFHYLFIRGIIQSFNEIR